MPIRGGNVVGYRRVGGAYAPNTPRRGLSRSILRRRVRSLIVRARRARIRGGNPYRRRRSLRY